MLFDAIKRRNVTTKSNTFSSRYFAHRSYRVKLASHFQKLKVFVKIFIGTGILFRGRENGEGGIN